MNKILSILIILVSTSINVFSVNKTKEIKKSFEVLETKNITIDTEFARLQVNDTEDKNISFDISIKTNGKDSAKAKTILENIDIIFTQGRYNLLVKTKFGDYFKFKKFSNALFNNGSIDIQITANIPKDLKLELKMKNGDINIKSFQQEVLINLYKSKLMAADLNGKTIIKSKASTIKIENIKDGDFNTSRSEINIENADEIIAESNDSKYEIESIETFNIKSSRDKIKITQIEYLYGNSVLSKFEITELGNEIDYSLKFGNMNIFGIHNMFTFVKLDSKAAALGLNFMKGSNYTLNVKHKSVKMNITGIKTVQKAGEEKKTYITTAKVGKGNSKVDIRANNCKLRVN